MTLLPDSLATRRPQIALLTREYPPEVYGGAGVHVDELARRLRSHVGLMVHCFGSPRDPAEARAYGSWSALDGAAPHLSALRTMSVDLAITAGVEGAHLVHSHTWYANLAGHFAKLAYGIPHVMTTHSLEPLRPWKAEQLGGGYALSSFCERTAIASADRIIAVSEGMKRDILAAYAGQVEESRIEVIYNGVDPERYRPDQKDDGVRQLGVDPSKPYFVFVGRITRQKGLAHLLRAMAEVGTDASLVVCAGEADTPELGAEIHNMVAELRKSRGGIVWCEGMVSRPLLVQLLSHACAFVCPSIYEPFGIVNVEAMACGAAVVATRVGGIPEIVVDGSTGTLVSTGATDSTGEPLEPLQFASALAAALNDLAAAPDKARVFGQRGRERVLERFSWDAIAAQTIQLYQQLLANQVAT